MKAVKKVLTLLLILTIISQIFIPSNVKAQNTIRTYDSNSLYDEVAKNAVLDNKRSEYVTSDTGIDFSKGASSTNGQGVYTIASTKNDLYPIHYYRGNIDNNNVLFGGFCWQIVRTTKTGGVKLIYNGSPDENGKCEDTERDYNLELWSDDNDFLYMNNNFISFTGNMNSVYFPYWYELVADLFEDIYYGWHFNVSNSDFYYSEEVEYFEETGYTLKNAKHHNSGDNIDEIKDKTPLYYCDGDLKSCSNIKLLLWDTYDESEWFDYLELSNGMTYEDIKKRNLIFANDVEYKDGLYQLKNTLNIPLIDLNKKDNKIEEILNSKYHYYCDDFSNSCKKINYIYNYEYYTYFDNYELLNVGFSDGYKSQDLYRAILNHQTSEDSNMKENIDWWYDVNLYDYIEYFEDTVWYNDSSNLSYFFDSNSKIGNRKELSLVLNNYNKNDMFTVSNKNGNGKLQFPVGTITAQETIYAGSPIVNTDESSIKRISHVEPYSYLSYDSSFFTITPAYFYSPFNSLNYIVDSTGRISISNPSCTDESLAISPTSLPSICGGRYAVRPMVSLKHSMVVSSGDGSPINPYEVVEGNTVEYVIDGDMPNGFIPPEVGSYLKGSKVKMNGLKAGDIVNGYRFLGWHTEDVEVVDGAFDMPENKVVFVGKFEKIVDSPLTYDSIGKYLTTGIIGVVGLAGLVLLKKKI